MRQAEVDPKFVLKHALRMRNLFLEKDGSINDDNGNLVGTLGAVKWVDDKTLDYTIKPVHTVKYVSSRIYLGDL